MFEVVVMMMVLASIVAKLENKVMLAKAVEPFLRLCLARYIPLH